MYPSVHVNTREPRGDGVTAVVMGATEGVVYSAVRFPNDDTIATVPALVPTYTVPSVATVMGAGA